MRVESYLPDSVCKTICCLGEHMQLFSLNKVEAIELTSLKFSLAIPHVRYLSG